MNLSATRSRIVLGTLLIAAGVLSLLGQALSGSSFWPLIIIFFGLAFFVGMLLGGRSLGALAIPGSIITGIGFILLFQNTFALWETWAYAWALIVCFVGIGMAISGMWSRNNDLRRKGWETARTGFELFLFFGILIEFFFWFTGVSGTSAGLFWPVLLIAAGVGQLILRSYRIMRGSEVSRRSEVNLFWPVINIGAGMLWIMTLQGMLSLPQLSVLLFLWPVLLVAAGVNLLVGRRFQWVNLILGAVVVAGMVYVVMNSGSLGLAARSPWAVMGISTESTGPIHQWVTGSGVLNSQTRNVQEFDRVKLNLMGEMEIVQGSQPGLKIEGEDNLLENIVSEVRSGELVIETKPGVGFRPTKTLRYLLTVTNLEQITISGAADVSVIGLTTQQLSIVVNGAGMFDLRKLQAERLSTMINGAGTVNADGKAGQVEVEINGAGGFNGPDLQTEDTTINISGVGRATVWAARTLNATIGGAGSVSYYGDPDVRQHTGGIGIVKRLGSK